MREGFTPTQTAMLKVLSDGLPHSKAELHACLPDEMGPLKNISRHLGEIRKALRPRGQDVLCEYRDRARLYRWVRLLGHEGDG
ncbi:MAG: hypothetical protein WC455_11460 [Dehalococcoidia bacterium]|jgi:hypothetical protein